MNFISYLISINILTFFLMFIDKKRAVYHRWRISENILLLVAILGGCYGMMFGMHIFHHKTRKTKFLFVYLFEVMWLFLFLKIKNF